MVEKAGGKVLGSVKYPINAPDFSSQLLQAQASGADRIALASVGADLDNQIKQGAEFGIGKDGKQTMVGFLIYIQSVHAIGLATAQSLNLTSGFYWDETDKSRAFAKRFFETQHQMPSRNHAAIYTAITHYLEAIKTAGTDDAATVGKAMRAAPIDYFGHPAKMRSDGRVMYDLTLYRVKTPAESKGPWDYYQRIRDIPAEEAFAPANTDTLRTVILRPVIASEAKPSSVVRSSFSRKRRLPPHGLPRRFAPRNDGLVRSRHHAVICSIRPLNATRSACVTRRG